MEIQCIYNNLIQALRLIASGANIQIDSFPQYVNVADEIALLYNDIYLLVPQLVDSGIISSEHIDILFQIDHLFEVMSNDKSIWSTIMLENHANWKQARLLALEALKSLNVPYETPNLDFVKWVKG